MKRLTTRLAALGGVLFVLQIGLAHFTGYKDAPSTVLAFDSHMDEGRTIIYFGDSTLYRGDPADLDRSPTDVLLQGLLPEHTVGGVYHDAYHVDLIQHFCDHMTRQKHRPDLIIIPLHMRAFSPERARRPEYQFAREKLFLRHDNPLFWAFFRPLAAFKLFELEPITQEDYLDTEIYDGDEPLGTFRQLYARGSPDLFLDHVRACYFYPLDESHPHVAALDEIVEVCRREGVRPLFYVTPINVHRGDELFDGAFSKRVGENIRVLKSALAKLGVDLLDLSFAFPRDHFAADEYPEGYLNDRGRRRLAERLARAIREETAD